MLKNINLPETATLHALPTGKHTGENNVAEIKILCVF
jgi:hypothetical protein